MNQAFRSQFNTTVVGSLAYELLVLAHSSAILSIFGLETYGLLGSLLGIIHIVTHIADLGMTNSITPFLQIIVQNKQNWRFLLIQRTLLPHLPFVVLTSVGALIFCFHSSLGQNINPILLIIILMLIVLETIQSFMRQLLYALFKTKAIITTELGLLILRIKSIWGLHFLTQYQITISLIMWSHLASALICLTIFYLLLRQSYQQLPDSDLDIPTNFGWRLARNRASNYLLRLSRNIFAVHFLTPLFAFQFGLKTAGLFFFASKLAKIVSAVVKLSIGYSGNGLLARVKNQDLETKCAVFTQLASKLFSIVIPAGMLFFPLCIGGLHSGYLQSTAIHISLLCLLFLIITFFEFFFMLYEQWYILEEAAHHLCIIKLIELTAFFIIFRYFLFSAPEFLVILIVMRTLHFGFIATHAYRTWGITLVHKFDLQSYTWYAAFSCLCWYFLY
ncbi:hypothetical protein JST56_07345 [Candidatus Dependentiae bacterium]|nr:hypothetical protein [Candidatus Dependentiae bacterium]